MKNKPIPAEFMERLKEFEIASYNLLSAWPIDDGNMGVPDKYPFHLSFDDLCFQITAWREDCTEVKQ